MRGQADGTERAATCRPVLFRTVGGSGRRAMTGSAHNDTSALHASLHGAATRDPRGGETPMMRSNRPQLAACPASGVMRSNWKQKHKTTINQFCPATAKPAVGLSQYASCADKRSAQEDINMRQAIIKFDENMSRGSHPDRKKICMYVEMPNQTLRFYNLLSERESASFCVCQHRKFKKVLLLSWMSEPEIF